MERLVGLLLVALIVAPTVAIAQPSQGWERTCTIHIVAVSSSGGGVLGNLTVTIRYPGSGRVYISTSPASMVDTQGSARIAAFAASMIAGVDMDNYDFYYAIDSPSIIIGGPSAGSAMALATLILLENATCPRDVDITGMIQPDGSIGPVGGLKEKLEAAANGGARLFIVPAGQEVYTYYETVVKRIGPILQVERVPVTVNLTEYGSQLGVKVATAATLIEAYELATNKTITPPETVASTPQWLIKAVEDFARSLYNDTIKLADTVKSSRVSGDLARQAVEQANSSLAELDSGDVYGAAIGIVEAYAQAVEAYYIDYGVQHDGIVTPLVDEANKTINETWNTAIHAPVNDNATGLAIKSFAKLGIAGYYYQLALKNLEKKDNGDYAMPTDLFGRYQATGVYLAAQALALARWAGFWANLAAKAPGNPVDENKLKEAGKLLVAEAKTTAAYVETLLQEAGANPQEADLAVYLADASIAARDPREQIGYSIESIAESTRAIHSAFTLQPERTAEGLTDIAKLILARAPSPEATILLDYMKYVNDTKTRLLIASRAVLYAWTTAYLQAANTQATPEEKTATTTTSPLQKTTTTSQETTQPRTETVQPQTQNHAGLAAALAGIIGLLLGIAVATLTLKT